MFECISWAKRVCCGLCVWEGFSRTVNTIALIGLKFFRAIKYSFEAN